MKKAFLVTFSICTRVVVDCDNDNTPINNEDKRNEAIALACRNINGDAMAYLDESNAEVDEDTEMPYDKDYDEPEEEKKIDGYLVTADDWNDSFNVHFKDKLCADNCVSAMETLSPNWKVTSIPTKMDATDAKNPDGILRFFFEDKLSLHESDYLIGLCYENADNSKKIADYIKWCRERYDKDLNTEPDEFEKEYKQ